MPHSWVPLATHEWGTSSLELSGRLREVVNEHARVSFRYNSLGLPVEERCDEHLIERSYDKHGLIVSLRSSLGAQLSYDRNAYGELFPSELTKRKQMRALRASISMIV